MVDVHSATAEIRRRNKKKKKKPQGKYIMSDLLRRAAIITINITIEKKTQVRRAEPIGRRISQRVLD